MLSGIGHMSEYGVPTSGNPGKHRCKSSVRTDLRVTDEIVPPDFEDPSLTRYVKGFNGFHVTGEQSPCFGCIKQD